MSSELTYTKLTSFVYFYVGLCVEIFMRKRKTLLLSHSTVLISLNYLIKILFIHKLKLLDMSLNNNECWLAKVKNKSKDLWKRTSFRAQLYPKDLSVAKLKHIWSFFVMDFGESRWKTTIMLILENNFIPLWYKRHLWRINTYSWKFLLGPKNWNIFNRGSPLYWKFAIVINELCNFRKCLWCYSIYVIFNQYKKTGPYFKHWTFEQNKSWAKKQWNKFRAGLVHGLQTYWIQNPT